MSLKYVKNINVRKNICPGFERTKDITTIVIHGTGGGGTLPWIENSSHPGSEGYPERFNRYKRGIGLFHYLIDQGSPNPDGQIIEVINPDFWVYHASVGKIDYGTIGIELLNKKSGNTGTYSDAQIESLVKLCVYLCDRYPTIHEFAGHGRMKQKNDRAGKAWKVCPGPNFPWGTFQVKLQIALEKKIYRDPRFESCWF